MSGRLAKGLIVSFALLAVIFSFVINRIEAAVTDFNVYQKLNMAIEKSGAKIVVVQTPAGSALANLMRFRFDDCPYNFIANPVSLNVSSASMLDGLNELKDIHYHPYSVYFGVMTEPRSPFALQLEKLKYSLLYIIGRSRFVPAPLAIYLLVPEGCNIDGRVDWQSVWHIPEIQK